MPDIPEHDMALLPRLGLLLRIESLINIGCTYGPNDLEPDTWDHLVILAVERQYLDKLLDARRNKKHQAEAEVRKAAAATGLPLPGASLFPSKHRKR